eukprot:9529538-Ditylum_brightwellii.AAC.1
MPAPSLQSHQQVLTAEELLVTHKGSNKLLLLRRDSLLSLVCCFNTIEALCLSMPSTETTK